MRIVRVLWRVAVVVVAVMMLQSCKPGVPNDVLKMQKMEDVLYDFHLAQALASQHSSDSIDYYTRLYQLSALSKHGVTKADFDHSMVYYERHTDKLKKMYDHLAERFGGSVSSSSMGMPGNVSGQSLKGDTLSIWHGPSRALLSSQGVNRFTYTQRCDTALHAGDQLQMTFNVDWLYHEGERRGVAQVIVRYEGDSVAVMQHYFYSSGAQYMSLTLSKRKVERIDCYIYQCSPWSDRVRIVMLSDMKMFRFRRHDAPTTTSTSADSIHSGLRSDSLKKGNFNPRMHVRDSLIKEEKENERKPHFL